MDDTPTTADLLAAWRDATRASELAERLATVARESAEHAERNAGVAEEIAQMAEQAAGHAERAATTARQAAVRAKAFADESRGTRARQADDALIAARESETAARDAYYASEQEAHDRDTEPGRG